MAFLYIDVYKSVFSFKIRFQCRECIMQKILFFHLTNDLSGSPKVLSQIILSLNQEEYDKTLYSAKSEKGFLNGVAKNHVQYNFKTYKNKYIRAINYFISQFLLFFRLLKYFNKDVIFYVNTMMPFGAALSAKLINKEVIYHIHETSIQPQILKNLLKQIIKITADKIIYVSNFTKEVEKIDCKYQEVIYNALPKSLHEAGRNHTYLHNYDKKFNVLMVCSLKDYKGINEFIDIAKLCLDHTNVTFSLVLNADSSEINAFKKNIKIKNIKVFDRQTNLIPFYEKTSLLLNLSRPDEWVETFGLTIIEAMAFGIPVIVPAVGGPDEIVNEGKHGFKISCYETKKISELILKMSINGDSCRRISTMCKKRSEDFSEERFLSQINKIIKNSFKNL